MDDILVQLTKENDMLKLENENLKKLLMEYENSQKNYTCGNDFITVEQENRLLNFYEKYVSKDSPISKHYILCSGLNSIHPNFYESITNHSKWISQFILLTENIPICVSLSANGKYGDIFNPLIYVNRQFEITTQYERNEIVGKNCNFLQGPLTEINTKNMIKDAIISGKSGKFLINNYKKDGNCFRNLLHFQPIKYKNGEIAYYMCIQCDLNDPKTPYDYLMIVDDLVNILPIEIDTEFEKDVPTYFLNMIDLVGEFKQYAKDLGQEIKPHRRSSILIPNTKPSL